MITKEELFQVLQMMAHELRPPVQHHPRCHVDGCDMPYQEPK